MKITSLFLAPVLALALGACATPERAASQPRPVADGAVFRAIGDQREFMLEMDNEHITLTPRGENAQVFPRPEPRYPRWAGEIYETANTTRRLRVDVRDNAYCLDADGVRREQRVIVYLEGAQHQGCGDWR